MNSVPPPGRGRPTSISARALSAITAKTPDTTKIITKEDTILQKVLCSPQNLKIGDNALFKIEKIRANAPFPFPAKEID